MSIPYTLDEAEQMVRAGHVERVCAPGKWTVARIDGDVVITHHEARQ